MCWPFSHKWFESDRIWMWQDQVLMSLIPFQHAHHQLHAAVTLVTYHCSRCRLKPKQRILKGHLPGGEPDKSRSSYTWSLLPKE
jgi:hypothetical protein